MATKIELSTVFGVVAAGTGLTLLYFWGQKVERERKAGVLCTGTDSETGEPIPEFCTIPPAGIEVPAVKVSGTNEALQGVPAPGSVEVVWANQPTAETPPPTQATPPPTQATPPQPPPEPEPEKTGQAKGGALTKG